MVVLWMRIFTYFISYACEWPDNLLRLSTSREIFGRKSYLVILLIIFCRNKRNFYATTTVSVFFDIIFRYIPVKNNRRDLKLLQSTNISNFYTCYNFQNITAFFFFCLLLFINSLSFFRFFVGNYFVICMHHSFRFVLT